MHFTYPDRWSQPTKPADPGHMHLEGNLTYLEFTRLVEALWSEGHPDIPLTATGTTSPAVYPVITYSLELRKTHPVEPKMRFRENGIDENGNAIVVNAQRFQNIVGFTVWTETDPVLAEEICEIFEDFMIEYMPVFKQMGASELRYGRRTADSGASRPGAGIVRRTIQYELTTEKIIISQLSKIEKIVLEARLMLGYEPFVFTVTGYGADSRISAPDANFSIGDVVMISGVEGRKLPAGLNPGSYLIGNLIVSGSGATEYTIVNRIDQTLVEFAADATPSGIYGGLVRLNSRAPDDYQVIITDEFMSGGPITF